MPSKKWKLRAQREKWYLGETISVAIGQGAVTVTPIQLASAIGGMVSGGVWHKPHMMKETVASEPRREEFQAENIATVVSGMCGVVNEGGTGASAHLDGIEICGKTGTAQRVSLDLAKSGKAEGDLAKENGWFVGFSPRENPEIIVVALWEASSHGSSAAPIVRDVIKQYFDKKARLTKKAEPEIPLALLRAPLGR